MRLIAPGPHELALTGIAMLVCLFACYTTYRMVMRLRLIEGAVREAWLGAAGMTLGSGVWLSQFVASVAHRPRMPADFDPQIATIALCIATVGSWVGLSILAGGRRLAVLVGAAVTVASIGLASYFGGSAFDGQHLPKLDDTMVKAACMAALAVVIASIVLVWRRKLGRVTVLLALGVCCLHLTVLSVMSNAPDLLPIDGDTTTGIAVIAAAAGFVVTSLSLALAMFDQHLRNRSSGEVARLRRFAEATLEGVVFHTGGQIKDANATFCRMAGCTAGSVVGRSVTDLFTPASRASIEGIGAGDGGIVEAVLIDCAGREHSVDVRASELDCGDEILSVLAFRDMSGRKDAERQVERLSLFDTLTGLPNRTLFRERKLQAIADAQANGSPVAVFVVGLDRFKAINDTMGHRIGDRVLASVAERIRSTLRESDMLARLGGDEFGVLQLAQGQPDGAAFLARRILQVLRSSHEIDGQTITASASIGVALFPADAQSADAVLSHALLALDRAKREGRNSICFFEADADAKRQLRHELEHDLSAAIRQGELVLAYQPLVNTATLVVEGYEALSRWVHPRFGVISPSEFIAIAEEGGMIEELGRHVLLTACTEAASWPDQRRIAVNLSPVQCRNPDFPRTVAAILQKTGLAASRLELEVTEGVLIQNPERTLAVLRGCKDLGVRVALDDFGTGYSSLSYLRRFTVDKIKIDRSFVIELGKDAEADAIVNSILALGRALGLDVTAEGVETEPQLAHLRAHGASQVQGYLVGRPMPAQELKRIRDMAIAV